MSGSDKPDKAGRQHWTGRKRTQRLYPLTGLCQVCHKRKATQRHHRDGNEMNTKPGNVMKVCQTCMAKLDKSRWAWKGHKK